MLSGYNQRWGQPEPKVFPQSSLGPSPEAPAWLLEDFTVGTSGEQLQGQGQSRSRGTNRPALEPAEPRLWERAVEEYLEVRMSTETRSELWTYVQGLPTPTQGDNITSTLCDLKLFLLQSRGEVAASSGGC